MSEKKPKHGLDLDAVIAEDKERKRKRVHSDPISFRHYLDLLSKDSGIAQSSPARLWEIVEAKGTRELSLRDRWLDATEEYLAYSQELFGVHDAIKQVMDYVRAGALGLSTGKQILLLVGPTASGKSTFVALTKKLLEQYELRPVYKISGCPMNEEPLHLLPRHLRFEFERQYNVHIDGDLCPPCRHRLLTDFADEDGAVRWWDFPVEPFTFSVQGKRGIGSFEPSDERSQDVTELVGRENIQVTSTKGYDDPNAFSLSGEIEKGNRGIVEGRELVKADEKLLWVFISVAEEKELRVHGSNFPHISVDTIVVGHTNLTEYAKFAADQSNEALHDRIYVVPFPYPLRVRDEIRVYNKLIERGDFRDLHKAHIAPGALELAGLFAVLTRLSSSDMVEDLLVKAKAYNGDSVLAELRDQDKHPLDLRSLIAEGQSSDDLRKREGMFGASSRDVLAALNTELAKQTGQNGCLTPLRAIRALRDVFDHRMGYTPEEIAYFKELLSSGEGGTVMAEYREFVLREVSRAFLSAYEDLARELFDKYIKEARRDREQKRRFARGNLSDVLRDDLTNKPREADEKFLRSIEEHMGIDKSSADVLRGEILELVGTLPDFGFDAYPPLREAVEQKLLSDAWASLTLVLATDKPKGEEEKKRATDLMDGLAERGFCPVCAKELVEKATEFLSE